MSKILLLETDHMRSQIVPLSYHEQERAFQKSWNPSIFEEDPSSTEDQGGRDVQEDAGGSLNKRSNPKSNHNETQPDIFLHVHYEVYILLSMSMKPSFRVLTNVGSRLPFMDDSWKRESNSRGQGERSLLRAILRFLYNFFLTYLLQPNLPG